MATTKAIRILKGALAAAGVVTLAAGFGAAGWWAVDAGRGGPSELALHPERQDEINAAREAAALADRLALTPAQQASVAAIQLRFRQGLAAQRADPADELVSRAFSRLQATLARNREIAAVLTPAQRETFAAMQQEQVQRMLAAREIMQRRRAVSGRQPLLSEGNRNELLQRFLEAQQATTAPAGEGARP